MTNREKLANMALYDMLCRMNDRSANGFLCVLQMLDEKCRVRTRCDDFGNTRTDEGCHKCIARWLNEDHDE